MSEWKYTKLKDLTTKIGSGATPRGGKESYKDDGISLIRSLNVYDFEFDVSGLAYIDDEQADGLSNVIVEPNDILLNITGASVARCTIVPQEILPARVNQHVSIIRVDSRKAVPHYILYAINSYQYKQYLLTLAQGGATREAITKTVIENFEIAMPPIEVQRKIAAVLSAYDDAIENNTRRIKALEEASQALYREWFVEFRYPGHEDVPLVESELGMIPHGWEVDVFSNIIEINPRIDVPKDYEIPYIPMANISETSMIIDTDNIEYRTKGSGTKFQNYDTLFARITPSLENGKTGFVQFLPNDSSVALGSTEFYVFRSETLPPEYIYLFSRVDEFRKAAAKSMVGASGRQRVQKAFFDEYKIHHPDVHILNKFVDFATPIFQEIYILNQENSLLREARDGLLPRLVSGEVDVSNLDVV